MEVVFYLIGGFDAAMSVIFLTHPACADHAPPPGHPEQIARLHAVSDALEGLALDRREPPRADDSAILRCHPQSHLDHIRNSAPDSGTVALDPDTHMSPGSLEAAYRAAGAATHAVDLVLGGEANKVFSGCRPPGHHAERERPMGFCLFGNAAIAAKHALDHHGLDRVAVLDFDVHHGNGTQDLLWDDPRALFVSSHQMPLYPGTGHPSETGVAGNVLNIALPEGSGRGAMQPAWNSALGLVAKHDPQLVIVSAGFDAHADDPLAGLMWRDEDFTWITEAICDLADAHCGGKLVSLLEGGYDLDALGRASRAHVETLIRRSA